MKKILEKQKTKSSKKSQPLTKQKQKLNSQDGVVTLFEDIFQPVLDKFQELIGENKDKKKFVGGLIKIFTILLSTKTPTLTKIKKVIRTSVRIALEL